MNILRKFIKKTNNNILKKVQKKLKVKNYIYLIIATLIYAIAYNLFFSKNNIVYGGATGISIMTKNIINQPTMILILNIFFLILSLIFLDTTFTKNSILGSLLYPLFVFLTKDIGNYIIIENDNLLLLVIFGSLMIGLASGILFKTGFSTGGSDILNKIVSKYFNVSMGTAGFLSDGLISIIGGFFFGWTNVLYAIIVLYIINIVVDKVMLGISLNKAVYIKTTKNDEVCDYIINELNLGVTLIETKGGFTYKKGEMIMCIISNKDYFVLKAGVNAIDDKAVMLVTDVYQTSGIYGSKKEVL